MMSSDWVNVTQSLGERQGLEMQILELEHIDGAWIWMSSP